MRGFKVKTIALLSAVLAITLFQNIGLSEDQVIWRIGQPDDSAKEFGDYRKAEVEAVSIPSDAKAVTECAGISKGLKASINRTFEISYELATVPKFGVEFTFKLLHAHKGGPQMGVFSNGQMAGLIQLWGTDGTSSPYRWKKTYRLYIPPEMLSAGRNLLRLTAVRPLWSNPAVDPQLWWEWDCLRLDALPEPAREPIHGTVAYLGTTMKHSGGDFNVNDDTLRIAPFAFKWMGIAYSGNTIRADYWQNVVHSQPRRLEYLQLLRDLNLTVICDFISPWHYHLGTDGKVPEKTKREMAAFFDTYGALIQYYEIGNEPCMFGGGFSEAVELAKYINTIKPEHVKTTACGWAYGGGKGTPKNWAGDVKMRQAVEEHCQATNGHSYGFSYADNKGGSFVENLATYQGVQDGWPVEYVNTETGANDWHSEENGPRFPSTQPHAQAFDRIMRAHVAVVDRTMQHAAIFDDFGLFKAPTPWTAPETISAFPGVKGEDPRIKSYRRLALSYATHGAPLSYEVLNHKDLESKLVYFRAVDTAAIPTLPGSGGTSNKVLLNFVNFENAPFSLKVRVRLPAADTYTGERFGAGSTFAQAYSKIEGLKANPWVELTEQLGPGDSVQFILTPTQPALPYAPVALQARPGDGQIDLSWRGCSGARGYVIKRAANAKGPFTEVAKDVTTTSFSDKGLKNGTTCVYSVCASNETGTSPATLVAPVTVGAPLPPQQIQLEASDSQIVIQFSPQSTAKSYTIKRATVAAGPYDTIARGLTTTSYTDSKLTNGTTYHYIVTTVNEIGESPASRPVSAAPAPPPPAPIELTTIAGAGRVLLKWAPSEGAMSYVVKRASAEAGPFAQLAGGIAEACYVDDQIKDGTAYFYSVSAVAKGATSPPSTVACALPKSEALSEEWKQADIAARVPGSGSGIAETGVITVSGSGDDIWTEADGLHFAYQPLSGDGSLSAHILHLDDTHEWAKIGVMVRASLESKCPSAIMARTPGRGCGLTFRTQANGPCEMKGGDGHAWVKISRKGDDLIGFVSDDGKQWSELGRCKIILPKDVLIGLAVCSHDGGRLNKAIFEQVKRSE